MKTCLVRPFATVSLAACIASAIGCYPAYPGYPPQTRAGYYDDAKSYDAGLDSPPPPRPEQPRYVVDPAVAVAGVAAAGLLGYALGSNRSHHHGYYGPRYDRPAPYYGGGIAYRQTYYH